ncbi:MAG: CBS domain-containing protein [Bdellovibrionota bacterium]
MPLFRANLSQEFRIRAVFQARSVLARTLQYYLPAVIDAETGEKLSAWAGVAPHNGGSMKAMPKIQKVMTMMPHTIGADISIKKAMELMREFRIRHLPVQRGGELVGVISDRDIKLARSFQGPGELTVDDVMTPDPYVVRPESELDEVVLNMAEHKYGCAIVAQPNGKVVGILTDNDALRILGETLRSHYKSNSTVQQHC